LEDQAMGNKKRTLKNPFFSFSVAFIRSFCLRVAGPESAINMSLLKRKPFCRNRFDGEL